jgi:hypothetical protein
VVRERGPSDTIERCSADKLIAGVINARDEFADVDLVFKWSVPFLIKRGEHSHVRPFYVSHPETKEEIRVTCNNIDYHAKTRLPFFMDFQRYIVGRPNLINLPLVPVLEDKSAHFQAGCNFHYIVKDLWVWCFNDTYPARLEMDCSMMSPNMPIKIGDIERMLPYGMYLHKRYDNQLFHAAARMTVSNAYVNRKNLIIEQNEQIKTARRDMQSAMLKRKKVERTDIVTKSVPFVTVSSKFISAEKKSARMVDPLTGVEMSLEEMMQKSKDGAGAKKK